MVHWSIVVALMGSMFALGAWLMNRVPVPPKPQCARVRTYGLTFYHHPRRPPQHTTTNLRCTLEDDHLGPHCFKLNAGQFNERLDWVEDEPNPKTAAEVEANDDQFPAR